MDEEQIQKWLGEIIEELDAFETFHDKDERLQNMNFGKDSSGVEKNIYDVFDKFPLIKEEISSYMIETVISEYGTEDVGGYTFGWGSEGGDKVSDEDLLKNISSLKWVNKRLGSEAFSEEEVAEAKQGAKTYKTERNRLNAEISGIVNEIDQQRTKFYWDSVPILRKKMWDLKDLPIGPAKMLAPPMAILGQVMSGGTKAITQTLLGWTDWFRDEGMEKIENIKFNMNPETGETGTSFEGRVIAPLQHVLEGLYSERRGLIDEHDEDIRKKNDYYELLDTNQEVKEIINSTGFDEALKYATIDELIELIKNR